ncbi:unnamed protein product [Effrenium voratum]|uniref:Uncharacterized protein n=1 Tax=Effrenium voratum TaxID=2562239 RepID=A0AA36N4H5_9DINO|nr:unnamed protein product [Effrenium voratum]
MVGLMPTWQHLLQSPEVEKYDWLLNLEFDHLLRVRQLRLSIATYLARLSSEAKAAETDPLLLMFGNAFLFNRGMVKDMKRQWSSLGRTAPPGHSASGCPMFMEGHFEWPQSCSQDIVYPTLVTLMSPPVGAFGAPGCGQPPGDQLPLACFEFQRQPVHDTGLDQLSLVKEVAALARGLDASAAESSNATAALLRGAKDVPLFHHFSDPAARRAAVELLGA